MLDAMPLCQLCCVRACVFHVCAWVCLSLSVKPWAVYINWPVIFYWNGCASERTSERATEKTSNIQLLKILFHFLYYYYYYFVRLRLFFSEFGYHLAQIQRSHSYVCLYIYATELSWLTDWRTAVAVFCVCACRSSVTSVCCWNLKIILRSSSSLYSYVIRGVCGVCGVCVCDCVCTFGNGRSVERLGIATRQISINEKKRIIVFLRTHTATASSGCSGLALATGTVKWMKLILCVCTYANGVNHKVVGLLLNSLCLWIFGKCATNTFGWFRSLFTCQWRLISHHIYNCSLSHQASSVRLAARSEKTNKQQHQHTDTKNKNKIPNEQQQKKRNKTKIYKACIERMSELNTQIRVREKKSRETIWIHRLCSVPLLLHTDAKCREREGDRERGG